MTPPTVVPLQTGGGDVREVVSDVGRCAQCGARLERQRPVRDAPWRLAG